MAGYTDDELYHEVLWRKCRVPDWNTATVDEKVDAFVFFCQHFWHIKAHGRRKFELYPAQVETVRFWLENRLTVALKARQIGFSTLVGAFSFWRAFFFDDQNILLISKTQRHSRLLLNQVKYGYKFLPEWMLLRGPHREQNTHEVLSFGNESRIESLPSASEPGRGSTASLVVVDEIGFLPNSEDAYAAIEPVADTGGSIILLGTANGEGNLLHKVWLGAHGVGNEYLDYKAIFHSWRAVPSRDDAWYESKKRNMREDKLWQEYPSNAEEAFVRSGRTVFDLDAVDENELMDPRARGFLRELPGRRLEFVDLPHGELRIWQPPEAGHVYVIGADVSEGLEHGDFSCAHVLDARTKEQVAVWHGHAAPDVFAEQLDMLGRWYNKALLGVESNNHGLVTLLRLREMQYPNLYYEVKKGERYEKRTDRLGFKTSRTTKPIAIDELDAALRGTISLEWDDEINDYVEPDRHRGDDALAIFDKETVAELRTFVRNEKGLMGGSPFDDRVMALAIANQMLKYVWLPQFRPEEKPPPGTWGNFIEQLLAQAEREAEPERRPLGYYNVRRGASRGVSALR